MLKVRFHSIQTDPVYMSPTICCIKANECLYHAYIFKNSECKFPGNCMHAEGLPLTVFERKVF